MDFREEEQEQQEKVIKIPHIVELLVWLLILLVLSACFSLYRINHQKYLDNDYQIFLPDADGLIVGSPVKMMGIQVGHVTKIKPIKNEVFVIFVLTNPNVFIPQGSEIGVEFSGIAGSKSLEIYLPEKQTKEIKTEQQFLTVLPTKRLNESLSLLNTMYKKLMSIIYTTSSFGQSFSTVLPKSTPKENDVENLLNYSNKMLDDYIIRTNNLGRTLERLEK